LIKEVIKENKLLKESSYEDFLADYGRDIKKLSMKFRKYSQALKGLSDPERETFFDKLEEKLSIYDHENSDLAMSCLDSGEIDLSDAARVAINISNRYGTEERMVYNALEDTESFASMKLHINSRG
jgi:hypothetical protein